MYDEDEVRKLIHDQNNCMASIVAAAQLIECDCEMNQKNSERLALIIQGVMKIDELNKEFLNKKR